MLGARTKLATTLATSISARLWAPRGVSTPAGEEGLTVGLPELLERATRYAAGLAALPTATPVQPGDRVLVLAESSVQVVVAFLGHTLAGLVHVPVNTRYRAAELAHVVHDADPSFVVCDASGAAALDELPPTAWRRPVPWIRVDAPGRVAASDGRREHAGIPFESVAGEGELLVEPDDRSPMAMIYTSGTTGPSKGAVLSAAAMLGNADDLARTWDLDGRDRLVHALPLFHVHGLVVALLGALGVGASIDLLPRFDPAAVCRSFAAGATAFMGVPTMYELLLAHLDAHPEDAAPLRRGRLFVAGSAPLSPRTYERFVAATGRPILERYGMTETLITLADRPGDHGGPGHVGYPVIGHSVMLVDDDGRAITGADAIDTPGELWVKGPSMMTEYWRRPEATADAFTEDGWLRTGDVAVRHRDGSYAIVGRRSSDLVKSGGFKLSTREIEDVLAIHEGIREVAVVGLPDDRWGEIVVAAVVPHDPDTDAPALLASLAALASSRLADFKRPRALVVLTELPRNAMGKLQKARIKAMIDEGALALVR
jgi:acyl-CoA synthetase (AMP-forming)/AMP-acid ligase II